MSGHQRQNGQHQSQEQQRIWKPSDRQDSERPRQSSSKSRRDPSDPKYSSRGYTTDSPATASSQYRSGTTSAKTLHHPSRPSISPNLYVSRSQQPVESTSATPTLTVPQSQTYHSRSHAQRSQPEAQDPRLYSHKRNTSTPTPQSSYERVPSTDEFGARTSRTKTYVRASHAVPAAQTAPPSEIGPPSQEHPFSSRRHRERESEREKERDRDRTREKPRESSDRRREREPEKQDEETYRDRDRVRARERHRESSDRKRERDPEKRDEDAYREVFREAYRDRERNKERETDRVLAERITGRERERDQPTREPRSSSKVPLTRDVPESRVREHVGSSSGHRRYRSEETIPVTSEVCDFILSFSRHDPYGTWQPRRPLQDIRRPSTELRSQAVPTSHPAPANQPAQPAPTPHRMPVYLPVNRVPSHKASQERASSISVNVIPKGSSASDTEHTSRRDQVRYFSAINTRICLMSIRFVLTQNHVHLPTLLPQGTMRRRDWRMLHGHQL